MIDAPGVFVDSGQEMNGIDIHMQMGVSPSVKGRIAGMTGSPSRYQLKAFGAEHALTASARILENGEFLFESLPKGPEKIELYDLGPNGPRRAATAEIVVGDHDISGIQLQVQHPAHVRFRVVEEADEHPHAGDSVFLICSDSSGCGQSQSEIRAGLYVFESVAPGRYWIQPLEMVKGYFVKGIQVNGKAISDRP